MLSRHKGVLYLWLAVLIFGASSSVVRILGQLGAENPVDGHNPITFCNLLFAGNACAAAVLFVIYRRDLRRDQLRKLDAGDWRSLVILALLTGTFAPWMIYTALQKTMVTSVVIIGQLEPPLTMLLTWLVYRERFSWLSVAGAGLTVVGVMLASLMSPMMGGYSFGEGETLALIAAAIYAIATIIARPRLRRIPVGLFTTFRTGLGAIFFFVAALYLYGPGHFNALGAPFLWQWMLVYALVIVVLGQVSWFKGLKSTRMIDVAMATSAAPVAGILAAYLILGEVPVQAQLIGGAVVLLGIVLGLLGARRRVEVDPALAAEQVDEPAELLEAEGRAGFQGK